jgi:hypothetical protein
LNVRQIYKVLQSIKIFHTFFLKHLISWKPYPVRVLYGAGKVKLRRPMHKAAKSRAHSQFQATGAKAGRAWVSEHTPFQGSKKNR